MIHIDFVCCSGSLILQFGGWYGWWPPAIITAMVIVIIIIMVVAGAKREGQVYTVSIYHDKTTYRPSVQSSSTVAVDDSSGTLNRNRRRIIGLLQDDGTVVKSRRPRDDPRIQSSINCRAAGQWI